IEDRDIEEEYDISLSKFYDEYITKIIEKNKNEFINGFVDYLYDVSFDDERNVKFLAELEEERLRGAFDAYEGLYPNFLNELSTKLAEKRTKTKSKKFDRLLMELNNVASGYLKQVISDVMK
ncbi:MAG: hypothetical protein QME59_04730, partial [Candidatus Hydrothermarchaeota archaeon]|nr:hypothetical protein [Candidatus Hydrothermarchaeota archaeon]